MAGGWLKVPYTLARDPRVMKAGADAGMVLLASWAYSHEHMTDGRIPKVVAFMLFPVADPVRAVKSLIDSGLWIDDGEDYALDDFLEWNATKVEREEKRESRSRGAAKTNAARWGIAQPIAQPIAQGVASRSVEEKRREEIEEETEDPEIGSPSGDLQPTRKRAAAAGKKAKKAQKKPKTAELFPVDAQDTTSDAAGGAATGSEGPTPAEIATEDSRAFRGIWLARWAKAVGRDPFAPEAELRNAAGWAAAENTLLARLIRRLGVEELRTRATRWWNGEPGYVWRGNTLPGFKQFSAHVDELVTVATGGSPVGKTAAGTDWLLAAGFADPTNAVEWILEAIRAACPDEPREVQHAEMGDRLAERAGATPVPPLLAVAVQFADAVRVASEYDAKRTIRPQIQSAYAAACRADMAVSA